MERGKFLELMNSNYKYASFADWMYVYKNYIPNNVLYDDLQLQLIVNDDGYEQLQTYNMWEIINTDEYGQVIAIPRYCPLSKQLMFQDKVIDNSTLGEDININIKVPPKNEYQQEAINTILANDHGIICAKTAFGKTYVAINSICQLKKKALIIMHKRELMKQWKEDFLKYTDLTDDDIQIFSGDKFQTGKAITITTVQNICAKLRNGNFENRELFRKENFGITFFDECHTTIGPIVNSQATRWVFSKRIFGLSATPKRGDALDKVINYTLGDIIYTDNRKLLPVFVSFIPLNIEIPNKTKYYLTKSTKQYTVRYTKYLCKDEKYVNYCVDIIDSLIKNNKKILVVAAFKGLLETVYDKLLEKMINKQESIDKIKLVHGTSEETLESIKSMTTEEIENFNCIFSTNKFFSDGISINWLDTIVYLTPPSSKSLSSIPQLVGRIVREYKNKKYVNVIDIYNDQYNVEVGRMNGRIGAYKRLNYNFIKSSLNPSNTDEYITDILKTSNAIVNSQNDILIPFNIDVEEDNNNEGE